ncbi:MFS transporter [Priestia flexa]|uniref:MFS transporter n=1 Tax=Priestia flexa TaxID=86664 RepID=UPI001B34325D|nr:MFS transporter [Priestia flexa]
MQNSLIVPRLSTMMFLQYFVLGTWFSTLGYILSQYGLGSIIGTAYAVGGIAAIISPIFLGMLADRFFSSQKVLGVVNIVGGIILFLLPAQIYAGNGIAFLWLMFLYMLCYNPTYSLTNNISFHNVQDSIKTFPLIRLFGTIGFMVSGVLVGTLGFSGSPVSIQIGAVVSILLGAYSFTLPNTPAPAKGKPFSIRDLLFLDALGLLKNRFFLVFIICTIILFIDHAAYTSFASVFLGDAGINNIASMLTIGQLSEMVFILLIPLFFRLFGFKYIFLIGMFAWIIRMTLFSLFGMNPSSTTFVIIAIALHGLCWDFFFVGGYMYTNKMAPKHIKGQAQGLIIMATQGIGMFLGSFVMGSIYNQVVTSKGAQALPQWSAFWLYPAFIALAVAIVFILFFKDTTRKLEKKNKMQKESVAKEAHGEIKYDS